MSITLTTPNTQISTTSQNAYDGSIVEYAQCELSFFDHKTSSLFSRTASEVGMEIDRLEHRIHICENEVEAIRIRPGENNTSQIYTARHSPPAYPLHTEPEGNQN